MIAMRGWVIVVCGVLYLAHVAAAVDKPDAKSKPATAPTNGGGQFGINQAGITSPAMMELPLPRGIRCRAVVALRKDDDGVERNRVRSFEVVGIDKPVVDEFAPKPPGDAAEPDGNADSSFTPENF